MSRAYPLFAVGLALLLAGPLCAQSKDSKKEKPPADAAADAYLALRNDAKAPITAERLQQMSQAGFAYLMGFPTHGRVGMVIGSMAGYGLTIRDKKLVPLRVYWNNQLKYEIVNRRMQPDMTDDTRLVLAALGAAVAGTETRLNPTRESGQEWRGKIDALAAMPGAERLLFTQERDYLLFMLQANPQNGEALGNKLLEHPDKRVAGMARDELKLFNAKRTPCELKFTGLDGKNFDFGQARGKIVVLCFWTTNDKQAAEDFAAIREFHRDYKREVEVVTVCGNPEADRDKVLKFIKSNKLTWPVLFDGQGAKGEAATSLVVRTFPTIHIFNRDGMLSVLNVRPNQIEPNVKRLLEPPKK